MVLTGVREPQGLEFRTRLSRDPSDGFRIHIPCLKTFWPFWLSDLRVYVCRVSGVNTQSFKVTAASLLFKGLTGTAVRHAYISLFRTLCRNEQDPSN